MSQKKTIKYSCYEFLGSLVNSQNQVFSIYECQASTLFSIEATVVQGQSENTVGLSRRRTLEDVFGDMQAKVQWNLKSK